MIINDNENSNLDFDLIEKIKSTEVELMKTALIKAKGDPAIVAKNFGTDVMYVYTKAKELNLEDYINRN